MVEPTGKSSNHDPLGELTRICSIIQENQTIMASHRSKHF
jgi:hypothetical protein